MPAATIADVKALTPEIVRPIYKQNYWDVIRGASLPSGLDLVVYDLAINSGPSRAVKVLQGLVGVSADGTMGDQTIAALAGRDVPELVARYCDARLKFLRSLGTWRTFGKGWASRVASVRKVGLSWCEATPEMPIVVAKEDPVPVAPGKARDEDQSVVKAPEVQAGGATTIGTMGAAVAEAAEKLTPYSDVSQVIKFICLGLVVIGVGASLYLAFRKVRSAD